MVCVISRLWASAWKLCPVSHLKIDATVFHRRVEAEIQPGIGGSYYFNLPLLGQIFTFTEGEKHAAWRDYWIAGTTHHLRLGGRTFLYDSWRSVRRRERRILPTA